jgi:hypothetical protein
LTNAEGGRCVGVANCARSRAARRLAWSLLWNEVAQENLLDSDLGRLFLQISGVIVTAVAIGLLVPFATDVDDKPAVKDDRPDRVFP